MAQTPNVCKANELNGLCGTWGKSICSAFVCQKAAKSHPGSCIIRLMPLQKCWLKLIWFVEFHLETG